MARAASTALSAAKYVRAHLRMDRLAACMLMLYVSASPRRSSLQHRFHRTVVFVANGDDRVDCDEAHSVLQSCIKLQSTPTYATVVSGSSGPNKSNSLPVCVLEF
jgi:hypothetical protein